ncbi:MAG: CDP-2,3-bis-(O-geranylgeranyl)-sn-glycerol synthase [Desulfurococcales archaeon]|nr:CDP-2,3-bis-(O-geranylgeranyl)-sn-glycerol synthase [Desulfurococcales archaeon]
MLNLWGTGNTFVWLLIRAALLFLPALTANSAPLVMRNILRKRRFTPVDGGRTFLDGRRVFGDNKSWEGVAAGTITGTVVGAIYSAITGYSLWIVYGFLMGLGAMMGDLLNSFLKRRLNLEPGDPFIPFDQLSFLYVAYLFTLPLNELEGVIKPYDLLIATYLVLVLHPLTNLVAYWMKMKDNPW